MYGTHNSTDLQLDERLFLGKTIYAEMPTGQRAEWFTLEDFQRTNRLLNESGMQSTVLSIDGTLPTPRPPLYDQKTLLSIAKRLSMLSNELHGEIIDEKKSPIELEALARDTANWANVLLRVIANGGA